MMKLADSLCDRMREEMGITISIGVSYNKPFAKMRNDYKKPGATTAITPENYKDILWPLPVLICSLWVGPCWKRLGRISSPR